MEGYTVHVSAKIVAVVILVFIALSVVISLLRRSANKASRVDLEDLLLDADGKMSKSAVVMYAGIATAIWMMVYLTMAEKMTEGYFSAFLLSIVAPAVTKIIKGPSLPTNIPTVNPP